MVTRLGLFFNEPLPVGYKTRRYRRVRSGVARCVNKQHCTRILQSARQVSLLQGTVVGCRTQHHSHFWLHISRCVNKPHFTGTVQRARQVSLLRSHSFLRRLKPAATTIQSHRVQDPTLQPSWLGVVRCVEKPHFAGMF